MKSVKPMITWIKICWYDNSDSIEYTACIDDYPINEDDACNERILLTPAHYGIIADEDNRLLLNHLRLMESLMSLNSNLTILSYGMMMNNACHHQMNA